MSYSNLIWNDFYNEGLGPQLPLSEDAKQQLVSGVLPSGEAGGYDFAQVTTEEDITLADAEKESGIFHFNELISRFSNAQDVDPQQITDFTIFNPYIHHEHIQRSNSSESFAVEIPYISTYSVSIDYNPYGGWKGFGQ